MKEWCARCDSNPLASSVSETLRELEESAWRGDLREWRARRDSNAGPPAKKGLCRFQVPNYLRLRLYALNVMTSRQTSSNLPRP